MVGIAEDGGGGVPGGWYADPDNEFGVRYWDGTSWTDRRAWRVPGNRPPRSGYLRRAALLAVVPWLAFELVLFLGPVWAPDETFSLSGTLATALSYALFVGSPGALLALVTTRPSLVAVGAVVLTAAATSAAVAMVASDDAQAGLAVFMVWYVAVPLFVLVVLVEWILRNRST